MRIHSLISLRMCLIKLCWALSLLACGFVYGEPLSGTQWLEMMAKSGEMLNYSGRFVVSRNGEMNTLEVNHMGSDMGGVQKLSSVDGQMREIVSSKDAVSCLLPDLNMGVKEARQSTVDQYFPMNFKGNMVLLNENYSLELSSTLRIADRDCQQLKVKPKDQLRYGYVFCIDAQNYLLLSSDLIGDGGVVLESYRFVDVKFDQVEEQALMPQVEPSSLTWMGDDEAEHNGLEEGIARWAIQQSDSNFEINHSITRYSPALQSQIHHIILSDGLANISAFVVPDSSSAQEIVKELSMGALNANTKMVGGYKLTVLGEVPKQTVSMIADSFYMLQ